ncbi:MAG: GNAT family N-acetyltransferase [Microlunatus sp.]|nr:GNAT family N-acetyltransferase [Microlunatus sp.]MDN5770904.1 GNAT family N-acetyltransferase [Microlunatus sp.]
MDIALDRARPGERWVLRRRLADGSATDVIGWVIGTVPDPLLEIEGGAQIRVERGSVILAKRVPTARGGPDPRRTPAAELERAALPGWVALSEPLGEWTLRAAGGFTDRANSALAVGDPGLPISDAAARVVRYAAEHDIAPRAQVIIGSEVDADLTGLGWRPVSVPVEVLVTRLTTLLGDDLPDPCVVVGETLDQAWWRAFSRSRPNDTDPELLRMLLDGHPPRAYAAVLGRDGEHVAIARGHVSGPWFGITTVWTESTHRRAGLTAAMTRALGHWAARYGARNAYLKVAADDDGAHTAYAGLGFVRHHSYRHLDAPHQAEKVTKRVSRPARRS